VSAGRFVLVLLEELEQERPAMFGVGLIGHMGSQALDRHGREGRHGRKYLVGLMGGEGVAGNG
jgi:hypothetical protein